jgi:hypothetical protein
VNFGQRILDTAHSVVDRVQHMPEQTKTVVDGISVGAVLGAIAGALPAIAATFTIVWTGIRIWETKTVQDWLNRRKGPPA